MSTRLDKPPQKLPKKAAEKPKRPPTAKKGPRVPRKQGYHPDPDPPSEPVGLNPGPCTISIVASAAQRSFSPPLGATGEETFTARLSRPLAEGETLQWSVVRGRDDGDVTFDSPGSVTTKVRARKPNRARVRVRLFDFRRRLVCEDEKEISVPQFFFVKAAAGLTGALGDLGLQAVIAPADADRAKKQALNRMIRDRVVTDAIGLAGLLLRGVNVRFVTRDPTGIVGAGNFSTVDLVGLAPRRNATGETFPGVLDRGNKRPMDRSKVYAREFTNPFYNATSSQLAKDIFGGIAVRQQLFFKETVAVAVPGSPVALGEFVADRADATTFRQLRISAAFLAVARLVGSTIAHEAGHALGLVPGTTHNARAQGNLMDDGKTRSFEERTGILRFDKKSGALSFTVPAGLRPENLRLVQQVLPVLK